MRRVAIPILTVLWLAAPAFAQPIESEEQERARKAAETLAELASTPDKAIPRSVLEKAEAIATFPGVKRAGFVIGGQYGRGLISVRDEKGHWSPPSFMRLAGGSLGAQIGATETDIVLVVMNRRGVSNLLRNEFKIGGDASAAAGPVGREASASTDIQMRAEILSYSRSRGLFAGLTLNGASIAEDKDANARFYGRPISSQDIVNGTVPNVPAAAKGLIDALSQHVPGRRTGGD